MHTDAMTTTDHTAAGVHDSKECQKRPSAINYYHKTIGKMCVLNNISPFFGMGSVLWKKTTNIIDWSIFIVLKKKNPQNV